MVVGEKVEERFFLRNFGQSAFSKQASLGVETSHSKESSGDRPAPPLPTSGASTALQG